MKTFTRARTARPLALLSGLAMALAATTAAATPYTVNWLSLAPTPLNTAPPVLGNYAAPGPFGPVTMSISAKSGFTDLRQSTPLVASGSVTHLGDTYSWTSQEALGSTYLFSNPPSTGLNQSWTVDFTFNGPVPSGQQVVVGIFGLGKRSPNAGEQPSDTRTRATVALQTGSFTYLGEFKPAPWGVTAMTPAGNGAGYSLENSQTAPGGANPHWNSGMSLAKFDPSLQLGNTLTVRFDQTLGDGVGVNVGFLQPVPEPGTWAMFGAGLAGLSLWARRRGGQAQQPSGAGLLPLSESR